MLFIDLTNMFYRNLHTHILSLNEIEEYIFNIRDYLEIEDSIMDVKFVTGNDLGSYSFETGIIKLNPDLLKQEANRIWEENKLTGNKILFINLNILEAIFHEVVHAIQNNGFNNPNLQFNYIYLKELSIKDNLTDEEFEKCYALFSYERVAIVSAVENILPIIKMHYKDEESIFSHFIYNLYKYLMIGYSTDCYDVTCPADIVWEDLLHEQTPVVSNIDTYDKMRLGYQVRYRELRSFRRNKIRKILTKNNLL